MPKIRVLSVALLLLLTFGCTPKVNVEAERAAIRYTDSAWSKTAMAKDVDGFVSFFGDGASFFPPNTAAMTEREAIREWASDSMANPVFAVSWQATKVGVSRSGELGYSLGTYELTIHDAEGKPVTDRGNYVTVWEKQPVGIWKVVADIFNSDLPLPTAPTP